MIYDPMYLQTIYFDLHIKENFRKPTRLALGYKRYSVREEVKVSRKFTTEYTRRKSRFVLSI